MRVLVTGAAGFIGFHLASRLLERGDSVVGVDNMNAYYDVSLKQARLARLSPHRSFELVRADLADRAAMERVFDSGRFDAIVNLAAQAGVRYSVENPISLYAATKKSNEVMAHAYAHLFGIPTTGLRFFTVYGPWGRPDMALFKFTKGILEGTRIPVFNEGRMVRDFTYIDDIVEGVVRVVDRPAAYRILNIGNHHRVELMDYIRALEAALGRKATLDLLPMQPGDVAATEADTAALEAATGFHPVTPVEEGVRRFVAWYLEYHGMPPPK